MCEYELDSETDLYIPKEWFNALVKALQEFDPHLSIPEEFQKHKFLPECCLDGKHIGECFPIIGRHSDSAYRATDELGPLSIYRDKDFPHDRFYRLTKKPTKQKLMAALRRALRQ